MQKSVIYLASDHARDLYYLSVFEEASFCKQITLMSKRIINDYLKIDLGHNGDVSVDYPDFGVKLAMALHDDYQAFGIAVCGSGVGISIAVNRFLI